jgi:hypothetical protein
MSVPSARGGRLDDDDGHAETPGLQSASRNQRDRYLCSRGSRCCRGLAIAAAIKEHRFLLSDGSFVGGSETLGVKLPTGILDVADARAALKIDAPMTLGELLASGDVGALEQLIEAGKDKEFLRDEANIKFGRLFYEAREDRLRGLEL